MFQVCVKFRPDKKCNLFTWKCDILEIVQGPDTLAINAWNIDIRIGTCKKGVRNLGEHVIPTLPVPW